MTTMLYVHNTTACWMQWRRQRLVQVYCESITRERAQLIKSASVGDGIQTPCAWISKKSQRVRLLVDPVVDESVSVPAFDFGLSAPSGFAHCIKRWCMQSYLRCRALTCEVFADDITRYRRDQLARSPAALLQWYRPGIKSQTPQQNAPSSWVMVESGLPDFVIAWLSTLAQQGMEFTDVRPTSLLFALADRRIAKAMITVWAEGHRWRVIVVSGAVVLHVDQFASELAAVQGVKDRLAQLKDANVDVELCVTGHDDLCSVWPSHFPDTPCERRTDTVQQLAPLGENEKTYLPNAIKNLPLAALLQPNNTRQARVRVEGGASIRALLHLSKWRRRSHQTVAATVTAAVFSGYFVLLSGLHALRIVDLHGRADSELVDLSSRQKTLQEEASQLHTTPIEAAKSIERLPSTGVVSQSHNPAFLAKLAALLNDQPEILIRSLSWRPDDTAHWQQGNLSDITQLPNLLDNHINGSHTVDSEYRIVVIAGLINDATSQQFASDTLINFLDALAGTPSVVDVLPIVHSFASSTTTNLPSDLIYSSPKDLNDPRRFVVAVRVLSV